MGEGLKRAIKATKESRKKKDPIAPSLSLLVKLGSIAVHADEFLSPTGHPFDKTALLQCLNDPEVKSFIADMTKQGFVPVKR